MFDNGHRALVKSILNTVYPVVVKSDFEPQILPQLLHLRKRSDGG